MNTKVIVSETFHSHLIIPDDPWDCWSWIGSKTSDGYGQLYHEGRTQGAHRVIFVWSRGRPIREGMKVCHACDNPECCNPCHLIEGTTKWNAQDAMRKGRLASGERHGLVRHPEKAARGMQNGNTRFLPEQVDEIRYLRLQGWTYQAIADKFKTSPQQIGYIVRGEIRKEG